MRSSMPLALLLLTCATHAQNWLRLSHPGNDSVRTIYDVVFVNANTGWIAGEHNVRKTTDGGLTWTKQTPDPVTHDLSFMALHFRNADSGWAGGMQGEATIYYTTNGGQSWSPGLAPKGNGIATGASTWDLALLPSGAGLAAGSRSMGHTTDGRQWTTQTLSPNFRTVDFADSLIAVAAGGNGHMMRTVDGGLTWTALPSVTSSNLLQLRFATDSVGWCVGHNGTLLRTVDRGATWSLIPTGTDADLWTTFFFDRDTGYIGGEDGLLWKTTNGGTTWLRQPTGTSTTITRLFFLSPGVGWAVGSNGLILKTSPDTGAPSGLAYEKRLTQYSLGAKELYPVSPSVTGALPMRYTISPSLPAGLRFDSTTGILEGTPTQLAAMDRYVVEAINAHGSAYDTIQFHVVTPPTGLAYTYKGTPLHDGDTLFLEALVPATFHPTVAGHVDGYLHYQFLDLYLKNPTYYPRISANSPADFFNGFKMNPITGVISGNAETGLTGQHLQFSITAFNNSGASSRTTLYVHITPSSGIATEHTEKPFPIRLPGGIFSVAAPRDAMQARIMFYDSQGREAGRAGINVGGETRWDMPLRSTAGILVARISWLDAKGRSLRTDRRTIPILK